MTILLKCMRRISFPSQIQTATTGLKIKMMKEMIKPLVMLLDCLGSQILDYTFRKLPISKSI